jgi:TPR repeat protein
MGVDKRFSILVISVLCFSLCLIGRAAGYDEDDFKQAKKNAEKGDSDAELALGVMYDLGQGVPQNYGEALNWYRRAADHGNATAQNNLGIMYLEGQGVARNFVEAAKWIRMSANQGFSRGQINLGILYAEGKGVPRNYSEAIGWIRRAAEQGDGNAQKKLGDIYLEGTLAQVNPVEAYKWFSLAGAQGNSDAAEKRDNLARDLSAQQLREGQKLAAGFVAKRDPAALNSPRSSGTGFFVTSDGYFVTAHHVVSDASRVVIKTKVIALAATVVKIDKANDLALLKVIGAYPPAIGTNRASYLNRDARLSGVASKFRPLPIVDSSGIKLGDSISTLGFPNLDLQGSEAKFTRGEINSLTGIKDDAHFFQISAQIQPGNSGSPLLDRSGNVIGIVQSSLGGLSQLLTTGTVPQNVNYALKSSYLLAFLKGVPGITLAGNAATETADWVADEQTSVAVLLAF